MFAPQNEPKGIKNMFATECSRPNATKVVIGSHKAAIFPGEVVAVDAWNTARHTNQFAPIALITVGTSAPVVFLTAIPFTNGANGASANIDEAMYAIMIHPIKLPVKLSDHSLHRLKAFS